MAKFSAWSWPDTVRLVALPKKSWLQSTSPDSVRGGLSTSRVVTRNISPAPSASLAVMMGVVTYTKPRSWKKRWMAKAATERTRNTARKRLVRLRRCWWVRRNSRVARFFCMG